MPAKKEGSYTFACDILNVLACSTDYGGTIETGHHYVIGFVSTIAILAQGVIVMAIFEAEEHTFLADEKPIESWVGLLSMTVILFMVTFQIVDDVHGKVIILFESKNPLIFALAYLGYFVNILVLAVVTAHLGSLAGVVDMLTAYAGFVGLINLDNAIGAVVVAYWYPEVKDLFKKPVHKRDLRYSFSYLKFVFCCFNVWGIIFNSYLYSQRHSTTKIDIR